MARTLHDKLMNALTERSVWEDRQRVWYQMMRDGLPRRRKPFVGAADLHLPVAKNAVRKLLPHYLNSIFSRQQLASFTALNDDLGDASSAAAQALDWKVRNETNFQREMLHLFYLMLTSGRAVLKVWWDVTARGGRGGVKCEAIDPLFFIAQKQHDCIGEMDWFCQVRQVSVGRYARLPEKQGWVQAAEFIARIRGGDTQVEQWREQDKAAREGVTFSRDEDQIILFEAYERVKEGWRVRTYSPSAPDEPARPDFILPYRWQGEPVQPFVEWQAELAEKGWYSPVGTVEDTAPFEAYGTKMWNQRADWLEYSAKPLFSRDASAPPANTNNVTFRPGDALPPGLTPLALPPPPFALEEEIQFARQMGQETAQVPDFGAAGDEDAKGNKTATEWNYLGSFASANIQYKAFITGQSEGEVYRRMWMLYVMFSKNELVYFESRSRKVLSAQAVHDHYLIEPDARPDTWNKQQRVQRSVARFQMFAGNPNVNQEELVKSVLEDDDPRLVKRLFISSGNKAANEAEDEALEIGGLMQGYPMAVLPGENHVLRLRILFGKLQELSLRPPPATPGEQHEFMVAVQRMHQHVAQHMALLRAENPAVFKQFAAAIHTLDPSGAGGGQSISVPPGTGVQRMGEDSNGEGGAELAGNGSAGQPALPAPGGPMALAV